MFRTDKAPSIKFKKVVSFLLQRNWISILIKNPQYASYEFTRIIKKHDDLVCQIMSEKGNYRDNTVAESSSKSLKVKWVYS